MRRSRLRFAGVNRHDRTPHDAPASMHVNSTNATPAGRVQPLSTRAAIGATAIVTLPTGKKIVSYVDGGNGHSGKRSHSVHIGLGDIPHTAKLNVEIRWRSGDHVESQSFDLTPGRHTLILEEQRAATRGEAA
ncbi:MAG: ASPIC/UnbV domain-containing protein [Planctomycetes bacterium]|nr:ASPIC/UnbV domain-containing protein [Planctomycetota bacterium]